MDLNSLQNLHDLRFAYTFKPRPNLSFGLEAHLQRLDRTTDSWYNVAGVARAGGAANAGTGYAISPNFSHTLGQEIDLVGSWHFIPSSQLEVGVSRYFRGSYIKQSLSTAGLHERQLRLRATNGQPVNLDQPQIPLIKQIVHTSS